MSQVQQIKEATSIIEIIGERINLTHAGTHYRGLCPFHGEKSPSFFVNEQLGIYKCFGCQEGGDVISFLEKYESMTFMEALEYLAEKAGIVLDKKNSKKEDQEHDKILEILSDAADYFQLLLKHPVGGKQVKDYLKNRGINSDAIKLFRLGATSDSWDGLCRYLTQNKKHRYADILKTGMVIKSKNGRYFDRFRGRLMFPLKNHRGQIVGFSGRIIKDDPKEAKYLNTPETTVYHKSQLFYGLSENMSAIKKEKEVIVVEGEFDMISSVQAYVTNVVAIKGSALTEDHARLIKRYAQKVYLALDMDDAGMEATKKAAHNLEKEQVALRVIVIPDGKDPDELAQKQPLVWRETVKKSISIYDFFLQTLKKKIDVKTIEGKTQLIKEMAPVLAQIDNAVEADHYYQKIAQLLEIRKDAVIQDVKQYHRQASLKNKKGQRQEETKTATIDKKTSTKKSPQQMAKVKKEKYLLFLTLYMDGEKIKERVTQIIEQNLKWQAPEVIELIKKINEFKPQFELEKFNQFLPADMQKRLTDIYLDPVFSEHLESLDLDREWQSVWRELKNEEIKAKLQKLNTELELLDGQETKKADDDQQQEKILMEIIKLQKQLKV